MGCTSSEGKSPGPGGAPPDPAHQLITVDSFVSFLKGLKDNPDTVLVAALAGPSTPYVVAPAPTMLASGGSEQQPSVAHSCMQNSGEYADPGVRIKNWLDAFGGNGVFEPICAPDFAPAMTAIATAIGKKLSTQCVTGTVEAKADGSGDLDCAISSMVTDANGMNVTKNVIQCPNNSAAAATLDAPCWRLTVDAMACPPAAGGVPNKRLDICYDPMCLTTVRPLGSANASVSCALCPSGTVPPGAVEPPLRGNATTCP